MLNLSTIFSTILLGIMLFFAAVVAPTIHSKLDQDHAIAFSRSLFPKYFLCGIILCVLAGGFAISAGSNSYILLLIVLIGFVYSRKVLMPKINNAKDQWLASDSAHDKARFASLHKRSVIINVTQIF